MHDNHFPPDNAPKVCFTPAHPWHHPTIGHWQTEHTGHVSATVGVSISLGDDAVPANFLGFRGLATLLPHFCQLSVPEVGVCGVYPESP